MTLSVIAVLLLVASGSASQDADNMKAFPPAQKGMARYVLHLPKQADESEFTVELIVGKTVHVDEHNRYFFGGKIEEETITGWGFTRYTLSTLGQMGGTLMAVDPLAPKIAKFIALGGAPYTVRYNSSVPIVVYVPEGVEVRYRTWRAGAEAKAVPMG